MGGCARLSVRFSDGVGAIPPEEPSVARSKHPGAYRSSIPDCIGSGKPCLSRLIFHLSLNCLVRGKPRYRLGIGRGQNISPLAETGNLLNRGAASTSQFDRHPVAAAD